MTQERISIMELVVPSRFAGRITTDDRRELRRTVAAINEELRKVGRVAVIGRFIMFQRNHYFGFTAIYAMERVPEVEGLIA